MIGDNDQLERELEAFLADDSRVAALYRRLPKDEPDAKLDSAIIAKAHASVAARRTRPRWLPAMSAAAALVVVAGLAYRVGPKVWNERSAVSEKAEQNISTPATMPAPATINEPRQSAEAAGAAVSRAAPMPAPPQPIELEHERYNSSEKTRDEYDEVQRQKPAATAPAKPSAPAKKLQSADKQTARDNVDAANASANVLQPQVESRMKSMTSPPRLDAVPESASQPAPAPVPKATPFPAAPAAYSPPPPPPSPPASAPAPAPKRELPKSSAADVEVNLYPEHWVADIRQMLKDGHHDDAIRNLATFRKRYPDYKLPDDLRDLK